jgi:hypothetical protein
MHLLIAALTALMLFATPVVADREDADAAFKASDYQKAFSSLTTLYSHNLPVWTLMHCIPLVFLKGVHAP